MGTGLEPTSCGECGASDKRPLTPADIARELASATADIGYGEFVFAIFDHGEYRMHLSHYVNGGPAKWAWFGNDPEAMVREVRERVASLAQKAAA